MNATSYDECGAQALTYFAFPAVCYLKLGHAGEHQSADFIWLQGDVRAQPKPHAMPKVTK